MGKLTHTVKGPIASFRSADIAPIESLKLHFLPKQEGSGDPSPTNVRPITGWTGVNGRRAGKNLFNKNDNNSIVTGLNIEKDSLSYYHFSGSLKSTVIYIPCIPGMTYTVSKIATARSAVCYLKNNDVPTNGAEVYGYLNFNGQTSKTITVGNDATCLVVYVTNLTYDDTPLQTILDSLQIEYGNVTTVYSPYSGEPIPITFPDGQTIYGGYVDLAAGEIWKTHYIAEINKVRQYVSDNQYFWYVTIGELNAIPSIKSENAGLVADRLKVVSGLGTGNPENQITFYANGIIRWKENGTMSLSDYETYLESNPITICYEMATPVLVSTFSPQDLKTFLDYNNFWSDTNDNTEVEYCFADRLSERKLIMDTPHIASASGSVASFNTDLKAPIVDLNAHFTPVQEGSGDPSPTNIRPIYGRSSAGIFHANDNLIDYTTLPCYDASNAQHSFNEDILTVSVKTAGSAYNVFYQTNLKWVVPEGLRGKTVRFVCGGIVNSNSTHHGVMICEFRRSDGTLISDPTMFNESNNTLSRSYTIPADAVYCVFIFRMNQSTTVTFSDGDYIIFNGVGVNYDSSDTEYHKYQGWHIPVLFPLMTNILNIGLADAIKPGANDSNITISKDTGVISIDAVATNSRSYVIFSQVFPAGTYVIQAKNDGAVSRARLLLDIESDGFTYNTYYTMYVKALSSNNNLVFTLSAPSRVGLVLPNSTTGSPGRLYDIQLESGSNPTTFAPYEDKYFGGYIDLLRGKLVAMHGIYRTVFGPSNPAGVLGDYERHGYNMNIEFKPAIDLHDNGQGPYNGKTFCNVAFWGWDYFGDHLHYYIDGHQAYIMLPVGTDADTEIEFCAELATPIEYDITPQILKTLKGTNNIWSDANGNVDVKYWTH